MDGRGRSRCDRSALNGQKGTFALQSILAFMWLLHLGNLPGCPHEQLSLCGCQCQGDKMTAVGQKLTQSFAAAKRSSEASELISAE